MSNHLPTARQISSTLYGELAPTLMPFFRVSVEKQDVEEEEDKDREEQEKEVQGQEQEEDKSQDPEETVATAAAGAAAATAGAAAADSELLGVTRDPLSWLKSTRLQILSYRGRTGGDRPCTLALGADRDVLSAFQVERLVLKATEKGVEQQAGKAETAAAATVELRAIVGLLILAGTFHSRESQPVGRGKWTGHGIQGLRSALGPGEVRRLEHPKQFSYGQCRDLIAAEMLAAFVEA
ncbi:hypothetical protein CRENBAI_015266 [Crenichthys baileyi]|uniref:Uncharacterized protein n=1 Tax=Crenichthys baileyi TaxID=28760 RepID=A0AAV9SKF9_9TELE